MKPPKVLKPPVERSDQKPGIQPASPFNMMKKWDIPTSHEEMGVWMRAMRHCLFEFLCHWYHKSQHEATRSKIINERAAADTTWSNWEGLADIQTGEIYDAQQKAQMIVAMDQHYKNLHAVHTKSEYDYAQALWEDFLFYQNPLNRRGQRADSESMKVYRQLDDRNVLKALQAAVSEESEYLNHWQLFIKALYNVHRIGERGSFKGLIGPDDLHLYPETVIQGREEGSKKRTEHLGKQFPSDDGELELDEDAITERRRTIEDEINNKKKEEDPDAMEIDNGNPKAEVPYYSATRASSWRDDRGQPVATSWESSAEWGDVVGTVRRRCTTATPHGQPRWKVREVDSLVRTFNWSQIDGSDGDYRNLLKYQNHWVLDERDQRIPETEASTQFTHTFSTTGHPMPVVYELSAERSTLQEPGRMEKALEREKNGQHDDADDDLPQKDSRPSPSGGYSGGGRQGSRPSQGRRGPPPIGHDDDNDSDDGDLFTQAYRACVCACHHGRNCTRNQCQPRNRDNDVDDNTDDSDNSKDEDNNGGGNNSGDDDNDDEDSGGDQNDGSGNRIRRNKASNEKTKHDSTPKDATYSLTKHRNQTKKPQKQTKTPLSKKFSSPKAPAKPDSRSLLGGGKGLHQPNEKLPTETFRKHPTNSSLNISEYNPGFAKWPEFTQRNEVPAPDENLKETEKTDYVFYPSDAKVPMTVGGKKRHFKKAPEYRRDTTANPDDYPSGRYTCVVETTDNGRTTQHTLEWIPQPILRLFRGDSGRYVDQYKSWSGLEKMLEKDPLDLEDIKNFNKSVTQHANRRTSDKQTSKKKIEGYTNEDLKKLANIVDDFVHKHGVHDMYENQTKRTNEIIKKLNGKKTESDSGFRGRESVRSKLKRGGFFQNVKAATEDLNKREKAGEKISDSELKPKKSGFFTYKERKTSTKKRGMITLTQRERAEIGKNKRKRVDDDDSEPEIGSEGGEDGSEEDDVEEDGSDNDGDGDDDQSDGYGPPPKKKAKH